MVCTGTATATDLSQSIRMFVSTSAESVQFWSIGESKRGTFEPVELYKIEQDFMEPSAVVDLGYDTIAVGTEYGYIYLCDCHRPGSISSLAQQGSSRISNLGLMTVSAPPLPAGELGPVPQRFVLVSLAADGVLAFWEHVRITTSSGSLRALHSLRLWIDPAEAKSHGFTVSGSDVITFNDSTVQRFRSVISSTCEIGFAHDVSKPGITPKCIWADPIDPWKVGIISRSGEYKVLKPDPDSKLDKGKSFQLVGFTHLKECVMCGAAGSTYGRL